MLLFVLDVVFVLWLFLTLFIGWCLVLRKGCFGVVLFCVLWMIVIDFGEVSFGVSLMILVTCRINSVDCSFILFVVVICILAAVRLLICLFIYVGFGCGDFRLVG